MTSLETRLRRIERQVELNETADTRERAGDADSVAYSPVVIFKVGEPMPVFNDGKPRIFLPDNGRHRESKTTS